MKRDIHICVVGSANVDLTFRAPRFPQPGETLTGYSLQQSMGGKGANQAVAAARLGAQVAFIACVGSDSFGDAAVDQYRAEGINTEFVRRVDNQATGTAAIVVDDRAENCIVVVPGANAELTGEDVKRAANAIATADAVACQLETPLAVTLEAFRIARATGIRTVLTPAPAVELPDELLPLCDVCVPNRMEIERLVGRKVSSLTDARAAAASLLERGVKAVALTMGSEGAVIADRSQTAHVPAVKVDAVDTTGAGDAFTAALTVSLCEGLSLRQSAERASLAAALAVTRVGAQTSFARRAELGPPDRS
jgi:ribokinase